MKPILAVMPLLLFSGIAAGCGGRTEAPEQVIVAIDRSESTDAFREQELSAVDYAADAAIAHNCRLEIYCYDTNADLVYGPQVPVELDAVNAVKRDQMIPDPAHLRCRTRPAALLEGLDGAIKAPGTPKDVRIVLFTDGDNEFGADKKRLASAAQALGRETGARIAVVGVTPDNKPVWTKLLSGFGARARVASLADSESAVQDVLKN